MAGTVSVTALKEASGLAASARNPGVLWTHNDGSQGKIYALATNGSLLATFDVNNVDDLEDIAVGPGPTNGVSYLYMGDIGGSAGTNGQRSSVKIIRVLEPPVDLAWATNSRSPEFEGRQIFTLDYPDGSYDAESLMIDPLTADLFVVTKQSGEARVYRANLNTATNRETVTMEFVTSVPFHQASAGDISADGRQIVLRREDFAQRWPRCEDQSVSAALSGTGQNIPLIGPPTEPNGEGLGFLRDGTGYMTISEGTNPAIYFFRSICPAPPRFTLSISNLSVLTGSTVQFRSLAVGYPDPTYAWYFNGALLAGETNPVLTISNVGAGEAGTYRVVASNTNGMATNTATLALRSKPDLRITEVMSSAAASPGVPTGDWWELTSFETQPVNLGGWRFNDSGGDLTDAYVIPGTLAIAPGESIIFVEGLTATQFLNWWGGTNLPPGLQVISYSGTALSLGASGDALRLWDNVTASAADTVASVAFGQATEGVSFSYNPLTQIFGANSQLGINGAFRAAASTDIGSPGRIVAQAAPPDLTIHLAGDRVRIGFETVAGHRYTLEARSDFTNGTWTPTGDSLQAAASGLSFFEVDATADARFFRVLVD